MGTGSFLEPIVASRVPLGHDRTRVVERADGEMMEKPSQQGASGVEPPLGANGAPRGPSHQLNPVTRQSVTSTERIIDAYIIQF